jgi:hypothetical protein
MTTQIKLAAWTGTILLVILIVSAIALMSKPTAAQDAQSADMHQLLQRLSAADKPITFLFDRPFLSGETLLTVPDDTLGRELGEIGANYVCFSEPWNNTRRVQCTPYSNIVSVTYEQ